VNPLTSNLFTLLTLIVAPAVLTNASSVLGSTPPTASGASSIDLGSWSTRWSAGAMTAS